MKEVYIAYGKDYEVLYVGQGNIGRSGHCGSGASHNKLLNKYLFENGEGSVTVKIQNIVNTKQEAEGLERYLIGKLTPKFNVQVAGFKKQSFAQESRLLFEAKDIGDVTTESLVYSKFPQLKQYVDVLGISILKTLGYQESKIHRKYEEHLLQQQSIVTKDDVRNYLNLEIGGRYTSKQLKDLFADCFKVLNINITSKASCVSDYYDVVRANINGCRGYKIVGKVKQ